MKEVFPKLSLKLTTLRLQNIFIDHACIMAIKGLLDSYLTHLELQRCNIWSGFDSFITAIYMSKLEFLFFYDLDNINAAKTNSLVKLLIQTETLKELTVFMDPKHLDCRVAKLLVIAMTESRVKKLKINKECEYVVTDVQFLQRNKIELLDKYYPYSYYAYA